MSLLTSRRPGPTTRSTPHARSPISTAPTGRCCFECRAGAAPPERGVQPGQFADSFVGELPGAFFGTSMSSGASAFVVTKAPNDAALDHDGALRTLLARDDAGRRSRQCAAGLLHFSQYLLVGKPHQRGGD